MPVCCDIPIDKLWNLYRHIGKNVCGQPKKKKNVNRPKKYKKEKETLICDTCGRKFVNKSVLIKHVEACSQTPRPYPCEYCSKTFTQKNSLREHIRLKCLESKKEGNPNRCYYCYKHFLQKPDLAKHVETCSLTQKSYACNYCWKTFAEKTNLVKHVNEECKKKTKPGIGLILSL